MVVKFYYLLFFLTFSKISDIIIIESEKEKSMNKQEIFNHFSTIIDEMINNSLFWSTYWQRPYGFGDAIDGSDYDEMPAHILVCSGATRTGIVDQDYDWVVKFDVNDDAYGSACEREEQIYSAAKSYALDRYFAEVVYLGTYTREINFYDIIDIDCCPRIWRINLRSVRVPLAGFL